MHDINEKVEKEIHMAPIISLKGIDQAISNLNYRNKNAMKYRLIRLIRQFYSNESSVESIREIKSNELVKALWDTGDNHQSIKNRCKNLNSVRSSVNADLKKLYKEEKNPEGIMIGPINIFVMSEDAKDKALKEYGHDLKLDGTVNLNEIMEILRLANETLTDSMADENAKNINDLSKFDRLKDLIQGLLEKVGLAGSELTKTVTETNKTETEFEDVEEEEVLEEVEDLEDDEEIEDIEEDEDLEEGEDLKEDEILEEVEDLEDDEEIEEGEDLEENEDLKEDEVLEEVEDLEEDELEGVDDLEGDEVLEEDEDIEEVEDLEEDELEGVDDLEEVEDLEEEEVLEEVEDIESDDTVEASGIDDDSAAAGTGGDLKGAEVDGTENPEEMGLPVDSLGQEYSDEVNDETRKARLLAQEFDGYLGTMDRYYNQYILIQGGEYIVGSKRPKKDEKHEHVVRLSPFYMGQFPITNGLFEIFVEKTGYTTIAEKVGFGTVYNGRFQKAKDKRTGMITSAWNSSLYYETVAGACWYQPSGPGSTLYNKRTHPVVQIRLEDAIAFAAWIGKRLPTEDEWEAASRTANGWIFPWGQDRGKDSCNIENSCTGDTTPVDKYIEFENDFGIIDTLGNVMEWTSDDFEELSNKKNRSRYHIAKGGSWISGNDIRLFRRHKLETESHSNILGFRCVAF